MNYNLLFTLDYEIHGNGDGSPLSLMVGPTYRLMNLLEKYHQKLIIMADVAEILCFKRYCGQTGRDDFHLKDIEEQLKETVRRGHDVQLHIHSSYFRAEYDGHHFEQYIDEYDMAALPEGRIDQMVYECVTYLENLLRPISPAYKVWLFRAANWSMMPTSRLYRALVRRGITADTSVYKGGCQGGNVCYDYTEAYDNLLSYPASESDINRYDSDGCITEYPIYCEMRAFWHFLSLIRIYRMVRAKFHRHKKSESAESNQSAVSSHENRRLSIKSFFRLNPWKMDFNQATGRQLIGAMKRIMGRSVTDRNVVDVVLIGHSKSFIRHNERELERFLSWYVSSLK